MTPRLAAAVTAVVLLLPAAALRSRAQEPSPRVVPLQITGDAHARFSLVVLGDGYTAAEMPRFRAQVEKHLNVLWSIEPFRSYRNYLNVYQVEVVSPESGITCDPATRERRTTAMKAAYSDGCVNPNSRGVLVDRAAAVRYAEYATPHHDQILVLLNTDTYGGIGGTVATTSGGNAIGPLITPHELGHSLGGLQDEYTYAARGKPGGPYTGGEPKSIHLTTLSAEEMRTGRHKWWRWLDEPSDAGGRIDRFEGGLSRTTGIWRPSKHSMMISLGYYFDQVSRERMTERISRQVALIADSTPVDAPVAPGGAIWIETPQPVYHELDVTWEVDGRTVESARNHRVLDLSSIGREAPSRVSVAVIDPTPFVRDPAIRTEALTARRSWTIGPAAGPGAGSPQPPEIVRATQHERPIGGRDVVYLVPRQGPAPVRTAWTLNGRPVKAAADGTVLPLAPLALPEGTHRLEATVAGPGGTSVSRAWTIDHTAPVVKYSLAPVAATASSQDGTPHHLVRDEFTMTLDPADDQPGYVVAEFRVNGDGWHHYYGWPDAPPGTPFRFTPRGTTIKELVYGSLASEGLSPQPWEPREPGWGTHRIEYRAIDAAGNIGPPREFRVTLQPSPACTTTISAPRSGDLRVESGTTCVHGAQVRGGVTVAPGASLVALNARIEGPVVATDAAVVELVGCEAASLRVTGATDRVVVFGSTVRGDAAIEGGRSKHAPLLVGSTFGALRCEGQCLR